VGWGWEVARDHSHALLVSILKPSSCSSARHPTHIVCASREMQSCVGVQSMGTTTRVGCLAPPSSPILPWPQRDEQAVGWRLGGRPWHRCRTDCRAWPIHGQGLLPVNCIALLHALALHAVDALAWMGRALTTASSSPPSTSPSGTACSHGRRYQARKGDQGARPYRLAGWLHPGETGPTACTHAVMLAHRKGFSPFCALGTTHPLHTDCVCGQTPQ
jgi:hypothetical protein